MKKKKESKNLKKPMFILFGLILFTLVVIGAQKINKLNSGEVSSVDKKSTSSYDFEKTFLGIVKEVKIKNGKGSVLVEKQQEKIVFSITAKTEIKMFGAESKPEDIEVGQLVNVGHTGMILESDPAQGEALTIQILSTNEKE